MNFGEGLTIPEAEFQFMGSYIPITPEKPMPTRSNLIPVDMVIGRKDWQEPAGFPHGFEDQLGRSNWQEPAGLNNGVGNQLGQADWEESANCVNRNGSQLMRVNLEAQTGLTKEIRDQLRRADWQEPAGLTNGNLKKPGLGRGGWQERAGLTKGSGNQLGVSNWQERCEFQEGFVAGTSNYNGNVQSSCLIEQGSQNGGRYRAEAGFMGNMRLVDDVAGSYTQVHSDGTKWNKAALANLLATRNVASAVDTNGTSRSTSMRYRPLLPKLNPQGDYFHNLLASNGINYSGSDPSSNSSSLPQRPQNDFPIPYRANYNLNLPPTTEADVNSSTTNFFELTAATTEQAELVNNELSAALYFSKDESSSNKGKKQQNLATTTGQEAIQQNCSGLLQNIVDSSSAVVSAAITEKDGDTGIDLNKTPPAKAPKRRKHRPKVVIEGKPKRTPNNNLDSRERSTKKRKYERKKGLKETETQQEGSKETETQQEDFQGKNAGSSAQIAEKSCRRQINFNENTKDERQGEVTSQQTEMPQRNERASYLNSTSQAKEVCTRSTSLCRAESVGQVNQQIRAQPENQQSLTMSSNHPTMNPVSSSYLSRPISLDLRKDLQQEYNGIAGHIGSRNAEQPQSCRENRNTPIQQHIYTEGAEPFVFQANTNEENLKRSRQQMAPSSPHVVPKALSPSVEAGGSKGEHLHEFSDKYPHGMNLGSSLLCSHRSGNIPCVYSSETQKQTRLENGVHKNYIMPSDDRAIKNNSQQVELDGTKGVNTSGIMSQRNFGICNSNFKRNTNSEKVVVNKLPGDWYTHCMAPLQNLLKKYRSSEPQRALPEEQLNTEGMEVNNRLSGVRNFTTTAVEKHNLLLPPTPSKKTSRPRGRPAKKNHANDLEKQTTERNPSRTGFHGKEKELQNEGAHEQSPARATGMSLKVVHPTLVEIDEIIWRLKNLSLNENCCQTGGQGQNALVPYKGEGGLVPYEQFKLLRKHKPRPKVDLDPETNRIWKLLMGKEGGEEQEGTDLEKEKWWNEERRVFHGRADSFIARMHLVQGDRRFSRWKGSVVDSVIGVFLTQNVSDHLSSSAFMSLAARFPTKSSNRTCEKDGLSILVEEPEVCVLDPNDTIEWHEKVLSNQCYNQGAPINLESTEYQRDTEFSGIWRTSLVEAQSHSLEEEVLSSQDSFDSSVIQGSGGIRSCSGSNSETEDPNNGAKPKIQNFEEFYSRVSGSSLFQEGPKAIQKQLEDTENAHQEADRVDHLRGPSTFEQPLSSNNRQKWLSVFNSSKKECQIASASELPEVEGPGTCEECSTFSSSTASIFTETTNANSTSEKRMGKVAETVGMSTVQQNGHSDVTTTVSTNAFLNKHPYQQSVPRPTSHAICNQPCHDYYQCESCQSFQFKSTSPVKIVNLAAEVFKRQNSIIQHGANGPELPNKSLNSEEGATVVNKHLHLQDNINESNTTEQVLSTGKLFHETDARILKAKKAKAEGEKKNATDWDSLRKQVQCNERKKERSKDAMDSIDYEAMRHAPVKEISEAIKERGMNNMLAERIKEFLDRIVRDHGSIDLEWLRDVPPDKAKDYLLSIRGLGLKSVECVRLLTLHHLAFPVDTNVGRIAVRLGWVPLQPLPESLQLHLLELYPILESIQKYLWPRLCKLDQRTLYELHYQMITFGKVFCTKSRPNCNACPMRGECRHFASAFASARLALPGPEDNRITSSTVPIAPDRNPTVAINPMLLPLPENYLAKEVGHEIANCEPIIEEPATPEQECTDVLESDIEDTFHDDPDEIPTIKLNIEEFTTNLQDYMQKNMELQEGDVSKALVALSSEAASIPAPKLKSVSRLRTEHQVYQLPDSHPLLQQMDRREPDDPSPYLLAIWTPGETANSIQPLEQSCGSQETGKFCNENTCFSCNCTREANSQTVRGTLLIPCRTAMRGSFPLNGTYFQVNEVFADHESSLNPIDVPRGWLWNLPRRIVYFGTSVSTIFKGLSTEGIQYCFWKGFVCVRGFDQKTRAPRPLQARLHYPASKLAKTKNEIKDEQANMKKNFWQKN